MQLKWPMLWDLFSLFPAHAGVILPPMLPMFMLLPFPRTRGGDPEWFRDENLQQPFSSHTRG